MSAQGVAIAVLLGAGLAVDVACCLGLAMLPGVYERIHLVGPAAFLGSLCIGAAVVTQEALSPLGVKSLLVILVMWSTSPVLAHATARAARIRQRGDITARAESRTR